MPKICLLHYVSSYDKTTYQPLDVLYLREFAQSRLSFQDEILVVDDISEISSDCDLVGISCMSQDFGDVEKLCSVLADQGKTVILGGYHISFAPETLPASVPVGVMFEGEETFCELLQIFHEYGRIDPDYLRNVAGVVYSNCGRIVVNHRREPIRPLDQIPIPKREPILHPSWRKKQPVFSSRGCPYSCAFCASAAFWEKFRCFSAEYVVREIEQLVSQYPELEEITFVDDLFVANRRRLRQIVALMEQRGLAGAVRINGGIRADSVDEECCELLARLNANFIYFGLESTSPRLLKKLKDGRQDADIALAALERLSKYSFTVGVTLIFGTPGESEKDVVGTYRFVVDNMRSGLITEVASNILCPMPGSKIWKECLASGQIRMPFNWDSLRLYSYIHTEVSNLLPMEKWFEMRSDNQSMFLNEDMTEGELRALMIQYDRRIKELFVSKIFEQQPKPIDLSQVRKSSRVVIYGCNKLAFAVIYELGRLGVSDIRLMTESEDASFIGGERVRQFRRINGLPAENIDWLLMCSPAKPGLSDSLGVAPSRVVDLYG